MHLKRVMQPKTIAVVGGGAWCANVIEQCKKIGFEGEIWPVHPSRKTVGELPTYKSIAALPTPPDATFIGVNRMASVQVVQELHDCGAGGAVCFAAGFAEAGDELSDGPELQARLLNAAGGLPILGPNCYGMINYLDRALLWPDQHGGEPVDRGVAVITQSSNIAINLTMQARGGPLAYVVTAGNQAQWDLSAIGMDLLQDDRVTALGLHIEGIKDLHAMQELAHMAKGCGKPIIALKVGLTDAAQSATISHTASLAGSDAGASALFSRLGIARVHNIPSFLEALKLAHVDGGVSGRKIATMSCSGGEASLSADTADRFNLDFPKLSEAQTNDLRAALGPKVRLANPLDYNTYIWPDTDMMAQTFTAMMHGDLDLGIVILDFPRRDRCDDADWANVVEAVALTKKATGRKMAIMASLAENMPEHWAKEMIAKGIVPFCGLDEGFEAIAALAATRKALPSTDIAPPPALGATELLNEARGKAMLASHGVQVPERRVALSRADAARAAQELSFPLVLKVLGQAHKTEAGGVAVDLETEQAFSSALQKMEGDQFLVEEMATGTIAELLIGITIDPAHGYLLTVGAGGTLTEILDDTTSLLVPSGRDDIRQALKKLRLAPLLQGYRGQEPADIEKVIDVAMALQELVQTHEPAIAEIEINPLLARAHDAVAVDVLVSMEKKDDI